MQCVSKIVHVRIVKASFLYCVVPLFMRTESGWTISEMGGITAYAFLLPGTYTSIFVCVAPILIFVAKQKFFTGGSFLSDAVITMSDFG